jgi:SSS family solute:Na+ symporter
MKVHLLDYLIIATYFATVIFTGYLLRRRTESGSEFFLSGRTLPSWITGLAFMSANLGSLEVIGHAANAAKYGMMAASLFYWLGAIPAMVFLGVFMMPFYYGNRVRSSPEYLKLRFDERARAFNAIGFGVLTIFMSGINMYAFALVFNLFLNWSMNFSIWISALTVMVYIYLGGLRAAIYNEVVQFFLIFLGLLPLSFMGLREVGGWSGLQYRLPFELVHGYAVLKDPSSNPMGVGFLPVVLAFTIFGGVSYWCTDFLVVQRALAARDMLAARRTPLIAAFFKMLSPAVIVLPGLIGRALMPEQVQGHYNLVIPLLLQRYYSTGLLGIGLTALLASFMSGMAGNLTAFNAVWTFDIYQAYIKPARPEEHYVWMGRLATVVGTLLSVATSYLVMRFTNMGDYLVLIFSLFIFPMSAVYLLGMFWKRATPTGAFYGMVVGVTSACLHYALYYLGLVSYRTEMAANVYIIIVAWLMAFCVTVGLSFVTKPRDEKELAGLIYSSRQDFGAETIRWFETPAFWGLLILLMLVGLAYVFW